MWLRGRGEINEGMYSCNHRGREARSKGLGNMQQDAGGRRGGHYVTLCYIMLLCLEKSHGAELQYTTHDTRCKKRIGFPWHAIVQYLFLQS